MQMSPKKRQLRRKKTTFWQWTVFAKTHYEFGLFKSFMTIRNGCHIKTVHARGANEATIRSKD